MSERQPSALALAQAHPVLASTVAGILAGFVALLAGFANVPEPFPVVIGLAAVMPLMAVVGLGRSIDIAAYRAARGPAAIAFDVALSVVAAAGLGAVVAVLARGGAIRGALLVGVALAGTIAGGYGAFALRTRPFRGENPRGDNG